MRPKKPRPVKYPDFNSFPNKITIENLMDSYLNLTRYGATKFINFVGGVTIVKPYFVTKERLGQYLKEVDHG